MKSNLVWVTLLGIALPITPAFADDAPVGLLTMVKGAVQILRAGQTTAVPAKQADLIGPGDKVITGAGGEAAFLSCGDARSATLQPLSDAVFTALSVVLGKGKLAGDHKIGGCRLPASLGLSSSSQQQVGMVRTRGDEVKLRTPVQGVFISEPHPKFTWEPVKGAAKYELRVQNREEEVLFKTTVTGTEFTYPADGPALEPGQKYWWRLIAFGKDDATNMAGTFFQTLPATQAKTFQEAETELKRQSAASPQDAGPRILLAFLYEENGMYDAAARTYDQLGKQLGENPWIRSRLVAMQDKLRWDDVK